MGIVKPPMEDSGLEKQIFNKSIFIYASIRTRGQKAFRITKLKEQLLTSMVLLVVILILLVDLTVSIRSQAR
jgi:hypothetical protein